MGAQYHLGRKSLLQENHERALEHLEKAVVICQLNEKERGNGGESARVLWRMSQVYEKMGKVEDARVLLEGALGIKGELLASGEFAIVEGEEASWDALVGLLYR